MIVRHKGWIVRERDDSVRFHGGAPYKDGPFWYSKSPVEMTICEARESWPFDPKDLDQLVPDKPKRATLAITFKKRG